VRALFDLAGLSASDGEDLFNSATAFILDLRTSLDRQLAAVSYSEVSLSLQEFVTAMVHDDDSLLNSLLFMTVSAIVWRANSSPIEEMDEKTRQTITAACVDDDITRRQGLDLMITTLLQFSTQSFLGDNVPWVHSYSYGDITVSSLMDNGVRCMKGEIHIPFTIPEILDAMHRDGLWKELDPLVSDCSPLRWLTPDTALQRIQYVPLAFADSREVCCQIHWRLLPDCQFVVCMYSCDGGRVFPRRESVVRAEIQLSGYVLKQTEEGTKVYQISQVILTQCSVCSVCTVIFVVTCCDVL
jgi:hypothetical protein